MAASVAWAESRVHALRSWSPPLRSLALATRLLPLGLGLLIAGQAPAVRAADRCPGAETTLAILECLGRRLEAVDSSLATALNAVAAEARRDNGEAFEETWRRFSAGLESGGDPARQLRAFQRQRRQICQYLNAMSLQGSGFGVFVLSCECDMTEALLQQFRQ